MNNTYHIITFGCQMNENDSEKLSGILEEKGYKKNDESKECDVLIINTCSVRENADDRFFGNLGEFKSVKKARPEMIICVCGCMMQQEIFVKEIKEKYPFVDIIFGTHNLGCFSNLIDDFREKRKKITEVLPDTDLIDEDIPCKRAYKHKAYVSITFGCDNFCTYCIVPYTRGREKSREVQNIIKEITALSEDGCKEVMLLGQNVNSYGKGLKSPCSFAELLKKVSEIEKIERVRFMTSHPKDLSDDIIEAMQSSDKICHNIHLPMQSGSSRILKLMNRKYDSTYYFNLVEKLRSRIPDITISTDIIVGFPTESEEDFEETLEMVKKCRFEAAFTFIYSPREGTKAAKMDDQVPEEIIKKRFSRLLKTLEKVVEGTVNKYQDTIQAVIVDGVSKNDSSIMSGRTADNKLVNFTGKCNIGDSVSVKITKANTYYLSGEKIG